MQPLIAKLLTVQGLVSNNHILTVDVYVSSCFPPSPFPFFLSMTGIVLFGSILVGSSVAQFSVRVGLCKWLGDHSAMYVSAAV